MKKIFIMIITALVLISGIVVFFFWSDRGNTQPDGRVAPDDGEIVEVPYDIEIDNTENAFIGDYDIPEE